MAIEYNYDGPPSLEIYQDFIRTTTDGGLDQNVAIVAPHYDVFKSNMADDKDFKTYSCAEVNTSTWGDLNVQSDKVDMKSVSVVFKDSFVSQATLTGKLGELNSNLVILDAAKGVDDEHVPEAVNVGDMVSVKVGDTINIAEIVALKPSPVAVKPEVTTVNGITNAGNGTFELTGEYSGSSDRIYYIQVKEVYTSEEVAEDGSNSSDTIVHNKVVVDITTADGTDSGLVTITDNESVKLANSGMYISVATWGFSKNDYYQVALKSYVNGVVNKVYLDTVIRGSKDAQVEVSFGKQRSFTADKSQYTITDTGVTIGDVKALVSFGGNAPELSQVIYGKYFIEFRAISSKYTGKLEYITNDNLADIGYTGVENPMGAMVSVALKGGRGVYCTSVESDTVAAYRKAFVLLSKPRAITFDHTDF